MDLREHLVEAVDEFGDLVFALSFARHPDVIDPIPVHRAGSGSETKERRGDRSVASARARMKEGRKYRAGPTRRRARTLAACRERSSSDSMTTVPITSLSRMIGRASSRAPSVNSHH